jgi:hypothetical protein
VYEKILIFNEQKNSAWIEVKASFCEIINEDLLRVFLGKIARAAVGFDLTAGEVGHGVGLMRGWCSPGSRLFHFLCVDI